MPDLPDKTPSTDRVHPQSEWNSLTVRELHQVDAQCERFERALLQDLQAHRESDHRLSTRMIEAELQTVSPGLRDLLFQELLAIELESQFMFGVEVDIDEYRQRFPDRYQQIDIICNDVLESLAHDRGASQRSAGYIRRLARPATTAPDAPQPPSELGRYRIDHVIGQGGFGLVYLGHDSTLHRPVAIKVPHPHLVAEPRHVEMYLREAKILASLEHAHIIPVYDFGSCDETPCFIVSWFIDGVSLAERLAGPRMLRREAVQLVASIAEALHYSHLHKVVHRDVKPGNIVIDKNGIAYLADFGMALHDASLPLGARCLGTPAYMSPEQARGEGHRVDGRTDIFSLGAVLYEALSGRRPFDGSTSEEVLEHVILSEPASLQELDDSLPPELDRICLRALSKRANERYSTAAEMAADLLQSLREDSAPFPNACPSGDAFERAEIRAHPNGLSSFGSQDADFFPALLPGSRDRHGLPISIGHWKSRIEEVDAAKTFSVGVIYGPSGCGKSSFVKAGLIPRLSERITVVYVAADGLGASARLLHDLREKVPDLPTNLSLKESLSALRRPGSLGPNQKLLIVLDQFEQWLHARRASTNTPLLQALRQCDGYHVQCILLVRDDFWLAVSRFMNELEIDLVLGENVTLCELFDVGHAKKVLAAFGRAYRALPEHPHNMTTQHHEFLSKAVHSISDDGYVVCVRLAIFAEMMKHKPWTVDALDEVWLGAKVMQQSMLTWMIKMKIICSSWMSERILPTKCDCAQ